MRLNTRALLSRQVSKQRDNSYGFKFVTIYDLTKYTISMFLDFCQASYLEDTWTRTRQRLFNAWIYLLL